jgi:hypothetical protein
VVREFPYNLSALTGDLPVDQINPPRGGGGVKLKIINPPFHMSKKEARNALDGKRHDREAHNRNLTFKSVS